MNCVTFSKAFRALVSGFAATITIGKQAFKTIAMKFSGTVIAMQQYPAAITCLLLFSKAEKKTLRKLQAKPRRAAK